VPRYAAFLRAINIGGRRITNTDLRAPFEAMGLREVGVFRASGNVIFDADREPVAKLTARIEAALEAALGYEVVTFLRSERELLAMAAHEPFAAADVESSKGKLQVLLLLRKPPKRAQQEVLGLATDSDRLALGDRELYWLPSGGTQESELDQKGIVKLLGPTTHRTKGTVEQIARKYFGG
jgi:uncharacterized protein (DUF1697 family)